MEQAIRAERAAELGFARMMSAELAADPALLSAALHDLPNAPRPSQAQAAIDRGLLDLDGQQRIAEDVGNWIQARRQPVLHVAHPAT